MVNILPKVPGFGERLGAAIGGGLGGGFQQGMSKAQEFSEKMKLQEAKKKEDKAMERSKTLQSIKGTVNQLKSMAEGDVAGIGYFGEYDPRPEAQQNRGQFQTLTSDLFSFYKTLFPRGITQEEFKKLEKNYIPKSGDATSKMVGKLDGFMDLIERKLDEYGDKEEGKQEINKKESKTEEKFVKMKDPSGKLRKVSSKDIKAAKKAGYRTVK